MKHKKEVIFGICIIITVLLGGAIEATNTSSKTQFLNVTCGNDICEPGENSFNCAPDCSRLPFEYSTNFIYPTFIAGDNRTYSLFLKNKINKTIVTNLAVSPSLKGYVFLNEKEVSLTDQDKRIINFTVFIDKDHTAGNLQGDLVIIYQNKRNSIPLRINIVEYRDILIESSVKTVNKKIKPGAIIKYYVSLYSYESLPINLTLITRVKSIETSEDILYENEKTVEDIISSRMLLEYVNLSNKDDFPKELDEGTYIIELETRYKGKSIISSSEFILEIPFWTPQRIRIISLLGSIIILSIVGYFAYLRYQKWRLERMRYILPDLEKVPKKGETMFKVGKIPETTHAAFMDPRDLTTHCLCAGSTGSGKSVTASVIAEEALLKGIPVIAFDPTNQWTGFVKQLKDKRILEFYKQFGLTEEDSRSFKGLIYDVNSPDIEVDIKKYMNPGEITVFNLSNLKPGEYDQAVLKIVNRIFEESWPETHDLKAFLVFDECHRLLEKYGGKGGYIALEKACREFRKWGLGLLMISQVSADFKQAVAGNIMTEVQLNTKSIEDIQKIAQKYGEEYSTKITRQGIGVAMIQNPKYNNGKPWFIHFRPPLHDPHKISEEELQQYSTYSKRLDEIEVILDNANKKGKDVDEIILEFKLTRNKLKEGHFKMVDMYMKSLETKIQKL
jgi:hypothetical protein